MKRSLAILVLTVAAIALAGCRDEERHGLVTGAADYTGPADTELTASQVSALDSRILLQGAANVSVGVPFRATNERPAPPVSKASERRFRRQADVDDLNHPTR